MVIEAWRRWRERRAMERYAIPDGLWAQALQRHPFLALLSPEDSRCLREMAALFLSQKEFTGAGGLAITDEMAVSVAAQACLPVLKLGLHWYDGFLSIVMHPDEVVAERQVMDEFGVVHEYEEALVGEAPGTGPMVLTWHSIDNAADASGPVFNVVIHEFAHVLEMRSGEAAGIPPLPTPALKDHWRRVIEASHLRFIRRLDAGQVTVLDPYGAESVSEYFAVACEGFFVAARELHQEDPYLYELLRGFFLQDPAAWPIHSPPAA